MLNNLILALDGAEDWDKNLWPKYYNKLLLDGVRGLVRLTNNESPKRFRIWT